MVALLDRIMGDRSSFSLEQRLFHLYAFLVCLLCLVGIIVNSLLGLSLALNLTVGVLGLYFYGTYWFSRSARCKSKYLILVQSLIIVLLLPVVFVLNGGIVSSVPLTLLAQVQYFTLLVEPKWMAVLLFFGEIVSCLTLEFLYPQWIIPYPDELSQKIDIYFGLLILGLITFSVCLIVVNDYNKEKELLLAKTKELEDYKKELELSNMLATKAEELAKLGYWELDLKTNKITWSQGAYKIYDRDPKLGVPSLEEVIEMIHPDDRIKRQKLVERAITEGIPYQLEKRLILENGKTKTIKVITEVGKDENNQVVRLFGVVQDITESKQMEDKLRRNQAILAEAQRIAKLGYWEYDPADGSVEWSEQTFLIFGFAPDQKAPSFSEIEQRIHPDDRELHSKVVEEAIAKGRPYKIELRIILPDNSLRYVEAIAKLEITDGKTVKLFGSVLDITDRKLIEQELRNSEAKYRLIVENQTDFILRSLPDTTIIYVNQSLLKAFGGDSNQVIGKKWADFVPYDYLIPLENKIKSLSVDNPTFVNVNPNVRGDGTIGWTEWVNLGIFDQYGNLTEIQSVGRDITDRKLAEQALEKSKKQLLEAQRIAHLGSWEFDFTTTKWTWSPELFNIYGLDPSLGEPTYAEYLEMLQPEDRERFDQAMQRTILTGEQFLLETKFLRPDGVLKYLEVRGERIITDVGSPICLVGTVLDITDRVKMEKALQESEARFRNIANNIPGVILRYVLHPDGKDELLYISPGCYNIWGVSQEEALADVNKLWAKVFLEDIAPMRESILLSAQNLSLWRRDYRIRSREGEIKWLSGVGIPKREDNGDIVWDTIITDVTDQKRTQAELEELVKKRTIELEKSQKFLEEQLEKEKELIALIQTELKQKETLLKEVHHRVKNNLQIITSLMRLQHDQHQDPALKLSFQDSQNRIQAMALIHESLYRSDNLSAINTSIYFQELAEYLGQIYNAKSRNITISLDTSDIMLDIDRAIPCGLIVNELLSNSLKYAFVDRSSGTITISLHQFGADYLLQVRDNGIGLSADFNIHRSPSLGLRLVDRLVKQLRGHLKIGYDQGAVFSISFPL